MKTNSGPSNLDGISVNDTRLTGDLLSVRCGGEDEETEN
jgi:hypothetical protein